MVNVPPSGHQAHTFSPQSVLLFESGSQSRCARTLHYVVRVCEIELHGLSNFLFAHAHHPLDMLEHHRKRSIIGHPASHPVRQQRGYRRRDATSGFKRKGIGRGTFGDHPHDLRLQLHPIANRAAGAYPRSLADRHVHYIQIRHRGEELQPISSDAFRYVAMIVRHEVPATLLCKLLRVLFCVLEVIAKLDEIGALRAHCGILLRAVSPRHYDICRHLEPLCRQRHGLSMIAASRCNQPRDAPCLAKQLSRIDHRGTSLEYPDRCVVLMLHPHFGSETLAEQRPNKLRRGWHHRVDQLLRRLNFLDRWQRRCNKSFFSHKIELISWPAAVWLPIQILSSATELRVPHPSRFFAKGGIPLLSTSILRSPSVVLRRSGEEGVIISSCLLPPTSCSMRNSRPSSPQRSAMERLPSENNFPPKLS